MYNKFLLIMLINAGFLQASCMYPKRDVATTIEINWSEISTYGDLATFLAGKRGVSTDCIDLIKPEVDQAFLSAKKDPAHAYVGLIKRTEFNQAISLDIRSKWRRFGLQYGIDNSKK